MVGAPGEDTGHYYRIKLRLRCAHATSIASPPAPYDVLVIGGGIYGLAIAYEAASRGLRTALVEAGDFGGGTSFNHQKTAHGGLRSLQSARLDRALESIRERRALARIAPWLLRPLPFLVGTYRSWTAQPRSRCAQPSSSTRGWAGAATTASSRSCTCLLPRLVSKAATLRLFPGIQPDGLTGGAQWYDYQMVEADRLTFAFAEAADRSGADLANYVEAIGRRARRRTHLGDGGAGRAHRTARSRSPRARRSTRPARGRPAIMAMFGDRSPGPDAEGDEPGHDGAGERHRAGSAGRVRPDADARALARPRAHRHQPVRTRSVRHRQRRSRRPKSRRSSPRPTPPFPH